MSKDTNIEWVDSTVNPTMGCDGCELWNGKKKTCYAGIMHTRYGGRSKGYAPTFEQVTQFPGRMAETLKWKDLTGTDRPDKPWLNGLRRTIFVSDMSDALSKGVPFEYLKQEIIETAKVSPHIYLWLTKRPSKMAEFSKWLVEQGVEWPQNLWPGTSVTSQTTANARIRELSNVPGVVRFLSVEPMLEAVSFTGGLLPIYKHKGGPCCVNVEGYHKFGEGLEHRPEFRHECNIHWVIFGGESGQGAEPCKMAWIRDGVKQCKAAGMAVFVKQLGSNLSDDDLAECSKASGKSMHDPKGGDMTEWPEDLRIRQFPQLTTQNISR